MHKNYYFIADNHFCHRNIIEYSRRPFDSVEDMNETMISNWNRVVKKHDIIYHLGDLIFEKDLKVRETLLHRLNGEKHIIWGNHDKSLKKTGWQKHFVSASDLRTIHIPNGSRYGQIIVLCHYPLFRWDQSHYGSWCLHGHCHNILPDDPNTLRIDVGVDGWDYTPVSLEQIRERMSQKTFIPISRRSER